MNDSIDARMDWIAGQLLALEAAVAGLIAIHPEQERCRAAVDASTIAALGTIETIRSATTDLISGFQDVAGRIRDTPSLLK